MDLPDSENIAYLSQQRSEQVFSDEELPYESFEIETISSLCGVFELSHDL